MKNVEFRKVLIEIRKAKGLTQEDVAEKCKITARTIQRIESGEVNPRPFTIRAISGSLGFDFYNSSNTGYGDIDKNQTHTKLKLDTFLGYLRDLFNLKTNTMKKLSILSMTAVIIILGLFTINSSLLAQTKSEKGSISIQYNPDKSVKRIEVRFTNELTYDSLVQIKSEVENYDIKINYKKIEFDDNNRLKSIACEAYSEVGSGSFSMDVVDSKRIAGFYCDYSAKANDDDNPSFCIGGCFKKD